MKKLNVLIIALIVVSVGLNIFNMLPLEKFKWPAEATYTYTNMFDNSVLWYRPYGTESMAMINMDKAVISVTQIGGPDNCMMLTIHTYDGSFASKCVTGPELEGQPDE